MSTDRALFATEARANAQPSMMLIILGSAAPHRKPSWVYKVLCFTDVRTKKKHKKPHRTSYSSSTHPKPLWARTPVPDAKPHRTVQYNTIHYTITNQNLTQQVRLYHTRYARYVPRFISTHPVGPACLPAPEDRGTTCKKRGVATDRPTRRVSEVRKHGRKRRAHREIGGKAPAWDRPQGWERDVGKSAQQLQQQCIIIYSG